MFINACGCLCGSFSVVVVFFYVYRDYNIVCIRYGKRIPYYLNIGCKKNTCGLRFCIEYDPANHINMADGLEHVLFFINIGNVVTPVLTIRPSFFQRYIGQPQSRNFIVTPMVYSCWDGRMFFGDVSQCWKRNAQGA